MRAARGEKCLSFHLPPSRSQDRPGTLIQEKTMESIPLEHLTTKPNQFHLSDCPFAKGQSRVLKFFVLVSKKCHVVLEKRNHFQLPELSSIPVKTISHRSCGTLCVQRDTTKLRFWSQLQCQTLDGIKCLFHMECDCASKYPSCGLEHGGKTLCWPFPCQGERKVEPN